MPATPVEEIVQRVLPWAGGMAGATLAYFGTVLFLNWRQEKRLQRIETELGVLRGMLLVLSASPQIRKKQRSKA